MWILVAEAFGALSLLLFIVWWTFGPTQRREREALERAGRDATGRTARGDVATSSGDGRLAPPPKTLRDRAPSTPAAPSSDAAAFDPAAPDSPPRR